MKAIEVIGQGRDARLELGSAPAPEIHAGELRVRVRATAVNRADLLQKRGLYPPPPGASPILGLECAGEVIELGPGVEGWAVGDRVMALLAGGGYAEEVCVHAGSCMPVPASWSFAQAGATPEVFLTCFLNLFQLAGLAPGEVALVHGGGSGIGTAAIALLREAGNDIIVTCGSDEKVERCRKLGARGAINYRSEDFAEVVSELTGGAGVDVILDSIGGSYLDAHLRCIHTDGRLVVIGLMGGATAEINLAVLLGKRLRLIGSGLRMLSIERKAEIVSGLLARFGEAMRAGRVAPVVDRCFPLADAQAAHDLVQASTHFGKVVLEVA